MDEHGPLDLALAERVERRFGGLELLVCESPATFVVRAHGYVGPSLIRADLARATQFGHAHPRGWDYVADTTRVKVVNPLNLFCLRRIRKLPHVRRYLVIARSLHVRSLIRSTRWLVRPDGVLRSIAELHAPSSAWVICALISAFLVSGCTSHPEREEIPMPEIRVTPDVALVRPRGSQAFHAEVDGMDDPQVTWDVRNSRGEVLTSAGTLTPDGVYTASDARGKYFYIRATSVVNPLCFGTAMVEVADGAAVPSLESFTGDDIEVIATEHARVFHRSPSDADARLVSAWLEDAYAKLATEFGSGVAQTAALIPVLDVHLHTQPSNLAGPGQATLVTRRDPDGKHATLHVFAPSLSPADARTMVGEAQDEAYYRRVLTHELSTLFLEAFVERKASGWSLGAAPGWFVQGYQEFLGLNCSTEHAREVTQARYRDALVQNPGRIGLTVVVANDYLDGAVLVRFIHERFGKEKVRKLLTSTAPTFDAALTQELGVTPEVLVNDFWDWLSR